MNTTTGHSIAALVAALVATPLFVLEPAHPDEDMGAFDAEHFTETNNGIDASSVVAIDVSADGSVDVYEG